MLLLFPTKLGFVGPPIIAPPFPHKACALRGPLLVCPLHYHPFSVCCLRLERFCYSGNERNIVGRYIDGKEVVLN